MCFIIYVKQIEHLVLVLVKTGKKGIKDFLLPIFLDHVHAQADYIWSPFKINCITSDLAYDNSISGVITLRQIF